VRDQSSRRVGPTPWSGIPCLGGTRVKARGQRPGGGNSHATLDKTPACVSSGTMEKAIEQTKAKWGSTDLRIAKKQENPGGGWREAVRPCTERGGGLKQTG